MTALERYHNLKIRRRLAGLNSDGKPFRRTPNYLTSNERIEAERRRSQAKYRRRAKQFASCGLTTRGTARKYALDRRTAAQRAWDEFRKC